ncbi:MAG: hypothetical protein ABIA47_03605 [bacterium]
MGNLNLEFVCDTTWDKVFFDWKECEAGFWECHYRAEGFESWEEWRGQFNASWRLSGREWKVYWVADPLKSVPTFWAGAFKSWRKYFPNKGGKRRFADLSDSPIARDNPKIIGVLNSFPKETRVIGFRLGDDIVIVEGMHRCAAIAIAAADGIDINTNLTIALTDFDESERKLFERARK